mmetsp:Transcript_432/g.1270  ORF Transcript_432/g.1270 Transcript_432/m.1270 type:complete len:362 (-) Transcript_432:713-1798(-)
MIYVCGAACLPACRSGSLAPSGGAYQQPLEAHHDGQQRLTQHRLHAVHSLLHQMPVRQRHVARRGVRTFRQSLLQLLGHLDNHKGQSHESDLTIRGRRYQTADGPLLNTLDVCECLAAGGAVDGVLVVPVDAPRPADRTHAVHERLSAPPERLKPWRAPSAVFLEPLSEVGHVRVRGRRHMIELREGGSIALRRDAVLLQVEKDGVVVHDQVLVDVLQPIRDEPQHEGHKLCHRFRPLSKAERESRDYSAPAGRSGHGVHHRPHGGILCRVLQPVVHEHWRHEPRRPTVHPLLGLAPACHERWCGRPAAREAVDRVEMAVELQWDRHGPLPLADRLVVCEGDVCRVEDVLEQRAVVVGQVA